MTFFIYNDCHWFSPISLIETIDQAREDMKYRPKQTVFLGDNFDFANCDPRDVQRMNGFKLEAQFMLGNQYIDGNHERDSRDNDPVILVNTLGFRIAMVHGDFEAWGRERAIEYRSKKHGASGFKRAFSKSWNALYDKFFNSKIDDDFRERCALTAQHYEADVLIVGHKHPKQLIETMVGETKVIVLPRGRNVIDIDAITMGL